MTGYSAWNPYTGSGAVILAIVLLIITGAFAFQGIRLHRPIRVARPGKAVSMLLLVMWILSIVTFIWASATYQYAIYQPARNLNYPPNPITPITLLSGLVTFIIISFLTRRHGRRTALGSAFAGAAAAPMIFELPFDLIIIMRTSPPAPPNLYRFLAFLPLFLVEISTFSLLTMSPLTKLSKYTLYALAAMFLVWTVWALFGYSYPSSPIPIALNDISKVLSFIAAITLFIPQEVTPIQPD